ncbi:hypothetical protein BDV59DRAFT_202323 [Aspergillus ambiguus]|uniref:leucine-rich repeat domain-containing protein n=1 Tax=Aspergillus ambiguus TaxID=176160 RepID=UPI003CCCDB2D
MDSEIPLPPPPRIRHRSPTNTPRAPSSLRKTYRLSRFDDRSSQPSSDPALFSSDDVPASGLENYNAPVSSGNRKRRYRGTWWGEMVKDPKRKRADFKDKRLVDSGVWMGSDESAAESLLPSSDASNWGEDLLVPVHRPNSRSVRGRNVENSPELPRHLEPPSVRVGFQKVEEPREHGLARTVVNECLERGEDSVDLSNGNLRVLPRGLLGPLQHLTKSPAVREPPVTEDVYSSLQPFLRLFLAGNALTALSGELFELKSLRVLSLRNNKLTDIPPAIRQLTMLQEVNLSVNRLQCLPWELLWLIKKGDLKHLTVRPNPLRQIEDADIAQWHFPNSTAPASLPEALKMGEYEGPAPERAWAPIHIATGPVRRFNMEGFPVGEPTLMGGMRTNESNQAETRVPSLREVSLLAFSRSPFFDQITDADIADLPALMVRLLQQAREVRNGGGRHCSVCHRAFVIARTEWVEWWDCVTYENGLKGPRPSGESLRPLPFRRFGCSWACVPGVEEPRLTSQGA